MKKLIITTLILLAVAGINNLSAQCMSQPTITWTGDCVYPTFCIPEDICTNDQKEKCFKLVYTVAKVDIDTQEIECRAQEFYYLNCEELHTPPEPNLVLVD